MAIRTASSVAVVANDTEIERRIYIIRGQKVMLDRDLAALYEVPTKRLNEQVGRNVQRFPEDFMFQMTAEELADWKSQFATSNRERMGLRKRPRVFTELGVAMLSSVLQSDRAIAVNIVIMRAFVRLRQVISAHTELAHRVDELEQRTAYHDGQLTLLFNVVHGLMGSEETPAEVRPEIGFHTP